MAFDMPSEELEEVMVAMDASVADNAIQEMAPLQIKLLGGLDSARQHVLEGIAAKGKKRGAAAQAVSSPPRDRGRSKKRRSASPATSTGTFVAR